MTGKTKNTRVTGGCDVHYLRRDRLPPLPTRTGIVYGKDVDYAWVMMDWSSTYRDHIKEKFSWTTYPIITKLDYESGNEDLLGGHSELLWFLSDDE